MGENNFDKWPTVLYGMILLMNGIAYYILSRMLIQLHGNSSTLATAIGRDTKGILSIIIRFGVVYIYKNTVEIGVRTYRN